MQIPASLKPRALLLAALLLAATVATPCALAQQPGAGLHFKRGWPWKIPLGKVGGQGIAFLVGVDNRLTAYRLDSGQALWSFQMGLGSGEFIFTGLPVENIRGKKMLFLLDDRGYAHALDVETGAVIWRTYDELRFAYPPVVIQDWVILVSTNGAIYKFDAATGSLAKPGAEEKPLFKGARVVAMPAVVLDVEENRPAYIAALCEERPGARVLAFIDFSTGAIEPAFTAPVQVQDLNERPVSAPLFCTGRFSPRGQSTMRAFVAVRRGANEMIYVKDFSNPQNPFTLFYKINNGFLCEKPVFTKDGSILLPNTSGNLYLLRPDGKPLKTIPVSKKKGAMSVELVEMPREAYGVMIVQSADAIASYQINFSGQTSRFGPRFPFSVYAWNVTDTQAQAQWKDAASKYLGEPRLPLNTLGDKIILTSQAADTAFMAVFPKDRFLEKDRKEAPEPLYWRSSKPGGSEFLSLDVIPGEQRFLVSYGELGAYVIDGSGAPRVIESSPLRARLVTATPAGALIFSENDPDGHYMALMNYDLKTEIFKEKHLPEPVSARPVIADGAVYYSTRGGVYKRALTAKAELKNVPVQASSPLTYHKGVLLVGARGGLLQAIDAQTLEKMWDHRVNGQILAAPTVADDVIYAATDEGTLYTLPFENTGGRRLREDATTFKLKGAGAVMSPPVKAGSRLYIASIHERGRSLLSVINLTDPKNLKEESVGAYYGEVRYPMLHDAGRLIVPAADRILVFDITRGPEPVKLWHEDLADTIASPLRLVNNNVSFICRDGSICQITLKDIFE
ncbi:MAG TPA: PQQ-binding-like beta-propeller repeat protein [Candidatus Brocadiia bacterium]|nr:PQQ-binding-like beta-propeller repeat protein [Candidatus Brocadiia bacterium]